MMRQMRSARTKHARFFRNRVAVAVVAGVVAFGAVYGFAAALDVNAGNLQAGNQSVGSCDNGVTTSYGTTYDASLPGYKVSSVTVSGIDVACNGKTLLIVLTGAGSSSLASATRSSIASPSVTFTSADLSAQPSAALVSGVSAVISG